MQYSLPGEVSFCISQLRSSPHIDRDVLLKPRRPSRGDEACMKTDGSVARANHSSLAFEWDGPRPWRGSNGHLPILILASEDGANTMLV